MTRHILTMLLAGAIACGTGGGTGPDGTIISVRVRDDNGTPVARTRTSVILPDSTRLDVTTGKEGLAHFRVAGAGSYVVLVIPRAGYLSTDGDVRRVTLAANETAIVEFRIPRAGMVNEPWSPW